MNGSISTKPLALYCKLAPSSSRGLLKLQLHTYYKKATPKKILNKIISLETGLRCMIFTCTAYIFEVTFRQILQNKIPSPLTHTTCFLVYYHSIVSAYSS